MLLAVPVLHCTQSGLFMCKLYNEVEFDTIAGIVLPVSAVHNKDNHNVVMWRVSLNSFRDIQYVGIIFVEVLLKVWLDINILNFTKTEHICFV